MKKLTSILVLIALSPLSALLSSWMCSTIWHWFLETRYGPGPSYQAWYGIAVLWEMMSWRLKKERMTESNDPGLGQILIYTIVIYISMFVLLGMAAFVRFALGWA